MTDPAPHNENDPANSADHPPIRQPDHDSTTEHHESETPETPVDLALTPWKRKKTTGSDEPVEGLCGAKLWRTDPPKYCTQHKLAGRPRCRLHGGKSLRGHESPLYRGRGYTKDLPTRLLDRIVAGVQDPELTSMRTEIALLDARMQDLVGELSEGGSDEAWKAVQSTVLRLRKIVDQPDMEDREAKLEAVVATLQEAVKASVDERATFEEIYKLVALRRRTADVETKREALQEHTLQHAQALYFVQQVLGAIKDEIPDIETQMRVANRVAKVLNRPETG